MRFDPARHELIPIRSSAARVARSLNARFRCDRFFVYRHRIHGTFTLARWDPRRRHVMTEFAVLGATSGLTRERYLSLVRRILNADSQDERRRFAKTIGSLRRDARRRSEEKMREQDERNSVRRRGKRVVPMWAT